jgi:hypothetical protein
MGARGRLLVVRTLIRKLEKGEGLSCYNISRRFVLFVVKKAVRRCFNLKRIKNANPFAGWRHLVRLARDQRPTTEKGLRIGVAVIWGISWAGQTVSQAMPNQVQAEGLVDQRCTLTV